MTMHRFSHLFNNFFSGVLHRGGVPELQAVWLDLYPSRSQHILPDRMRRRGEHSQCVAYPNAHPDADTRVLPNAYAQLLNNTDTFADAFAQPNTFTNTISHADATPFGGASQ